MQQILMTVWKNHRSLLRWEIRSRTIWHAAADALTVEATVSEGTLSYQWYRNNVDSNGGGTAIDGATEATYTPPTTESGTIYYYV